MEFEMDWEVDQTQLEALKRKLTDRRSKVGQVFAMTANPVEEFMNWYGRTFAQRVKAQAPKDTGQMAAGTRFMWTGQGKAVVRVPSPSWIVWKGSRPHWTSVRNLEGWAYRHGINPYALQRSIAEKGTRPNPFVERAQREMRMVLPPGMRRVAQKVGQNWEAT